MGIMEGFGTSINREGKFPHVPAVTNVFSFWRQMNETVGEKLFDIQLFSSCTATCTSKEIKKILPKQGK